MIRFVKIGNQINEDEDSFAFFDTVTDKFMEFDGEQVFEHLSDFVEIARNSEYLGRCLVLHDASRRPR
jgi:hypothetical protein